MAKRKVLKAKVRRPAAKSTKKPRAKKPRPFSIAVELASISKALKKTPALKAIQTQLLTKPRGKSGGNDRWLTFLWMVPVVFAVLVVGLVFKPQPRFAVNLTSAKIAALYQEASKLGIEDRIAFWSEKIYKKPDLLAPLGNGPEINDTAPLFPRGYDCTTFVETVGALSRSGTEKDLADHLVAIRYKDADISYETRNHFPEADWIPNNESAGILKDITLDVAHKSGFVASFAYKEVDKVAWFKSQRNNHANRAIASLGGDKTEAAQVKLPYIPLDHVQASLQHIPNGTVLNIVRENRPKMPVLITHQGFVIWKKGVAYFRHASPNKEISEMPLKQYLDGMRGMRWKVLGINLNAFQG